MEGGMIRPNVGNVVTIVIVSGLGILGGLAVMNHLARANVPVLSPASRGTLTFISQATTPKAA